MGERRHPVELKVDTISERAGLPDEPGDMEHRINRAITRAAIAMGTFARENRAVFLPGAAEVRVVVHVSQRVVVVPPDLDIEDVRRAVMQADPLGSGRVVYDLPEEPT